MGFGGLGEEVGLGGLLAALDRKRLLSLLIEEEDIAEGFSQITSSF